MEARMQSPGPDGARIIAADPVVLGASGRSWLAHSPRLARLYWTLHSPWWDVYLGTPAAGRRTHLAQEWVVAHGDGPGSSVLDLGCGTGACAEGLAARGLRVVALDFADGMLRRVTQRIRAVSPVRLTAVQADFNEPLPFRDEGFDTVVCLAGLHLARSLERVLGEVARVLRPGGLFVSLLIRGMPAKGPSRHPVALAFWLLRRLPGWRGRVRIGPFGEFIRGLDQAGLEAFHHRTWGAHIGVMARRRSPVLVMGGPAPAGLSDRRVPR
jgi:SAM-dependent methyltransferase